MNAEPTPVPDELRALSRLDRIDHEDAFLVAGTPAGRPPIEWAREVLAAAPPRTREALLAGWDSLGLRLDLADPEAILGWPVRRADEEVAILAADSPLGLAAELIFHADARSLRCVTLVSIRGDEAEAAWAAIEPNHLAIVPRLLEAAARRSSSAG